MDGHRKNPPFLLGWVGLLHYWTAALRFAFCLVATGGLLADVDAFFPFLAVGAGVATGTGAGATGAAVFFAEPGRRTICSVGSTLNELAPSYSRTPSP